MTGDVSLPLGDTRRALGRAGIPLTSRASLVPTGGQARLVRLPDPTRAGDLGEEIFHRLARETPEDLAIKPVGAIERSAGGQRETLLFVRTRRRPPTPPPPAPEPVQRGPAIPRMLRDVRDEGAPLAEEPRSALEPVIGRPLGNVRVHTGEVAAAMARRFGAEAFAVGRDVYFAAGKFEPWTPRGRALLAHELVHVRQQTGLGDRVQRSGDTPDSAEAEAERVERAVLHAAQSPSSGHLGVESYIRRYQSHDGRALGPREEAWLDSISWRALEIGERELGPALAQRMERVIDNLEVVVTLDLSIATDEQAAEVWGGAIADAVRRNLS